MDVAGLGVMAVALLAAAWAALTARRGVLALAVRQLRRAAVVTVDDVRAVAGQLPRAYEVLVRDRVKFRVGRIGWLAFSATRSTMGFAIPQGGAGRAGRLRPGQVPDAGPG